MKTFSTEKHNIPEGATGYREQGQYIEWFSGSNGNWRLIKSNVPSLAMCDALLPIIPIPQHEIEWNGEGLPPVGVECEMKCKNSSSQYWRAAKVFAYDGKIAAIWHFDNEWKHATIDTQSYQFRKPETPEQKAERERLEAAYDLYTHVQSVRGQLSCKFDWFSNSEMEETRLRFLAIVDKTNYRKESN